MPSITIKINQDLCIGAASCLATAPKFFELDEENHAMVPAPDGSLRAELTVTVSDAEKASIEEAVRECPTRAISLA